MHSLHAYFLRPGDPSVPIVYDVERTRDGRSFSTRRVVARQHGDVIFYLSASFQVPEEGLDHQDPMPDVPPPDDVPGARRRAGQGVEAAAGRVGPGVGVAGRAVRRRGRPAGPAPGAGVAGLAQGHPTRSATTRSCTLPC